MDRVGDEDDGELLLAPQRSRSASSLWRVISSSAPKGSSISSSCGCDDQAARDRHAHLHAARQLARQGAGELRQAHQRQRLGHARVGLAARHAGQVQRQPHVGLRRWPRASASATGTRRPACCRLSSSCATGLRHSSRRPSVGSSRPATILSSVLLPQPDGPEQGDELALLDASGRPAAGRPCRWDRSCAPTAPRWPGRRVRRRGCGSARSAGALAHHGSTFRSLTNAEL